MAKRKKKDPLAQYHDVARILLEEGTYKIGVTILNVHQLSRNSATKKYECELKFEHRDVIYGHVKEAATKLDAIVFVLEHLSMMGHSWLSSEETNDDEVMIDPLKVKRKYKPRKKNEPKNPTAL